MRSGISKATETSLMKYESEYISTPTHDANQGRIENQEKLKSTIIHYYPFLSATFSLVR